MDDLSKQPRSEDSEIAKKIKTAADRLFGINRESPVSIAIDFDEHPISKFECIERGFLMNYHLPADEVLHEIQVFNGVSSEVIQVPDQVIKDLHRQSYKIGDVNYKFQAQTSPSPAITAFVQEIYQFTGGNKEATETICKLMMQGVLSGPTGEITKAFMGDQQFPKQDSSYTPSFTLYKKDGIIELSANVIFNQYKADSRGSFEPTDLSIVLPTESWKNLGSF